MIEEALNSGLLGISVWEIEARKLINNLVKPAYIPSIEIQALITDLLEVTKSLLVSESSLDSFLYSRHSFYYNH